MCDHSFMVFGVDSGGRYRVCSKCKKKLYVETNADRLYAMTTDERRDALIEYFSDWAGIPDSYIFDLTRVKEAFQVGTMHLDDFEEWDDCRIAELVDDFLSWMGAYVEDTK